MTRSGRAYKDPCTAIVNTDIGRIAPYISIMVNNVQVFGSAAESTPPDFIPKTLILRGFIVFDRWTNTWIEASAVGKRNRFGAPKYVRYKGDEGRMSEPIAVDGVNVIAIPANAFWRPSTEEIVRRTYTLDFLGEALRSNINGMKNGVVIRFNDPALKSEVERAVREVQNGASVVSLQSSFSDSVEVSQLLTPQPSYIDDLLAAWVQTSEELDQVSGRVSLGEKNERRITEEITAIENAASSTIDVIIDTFNRYAKWANIDAVAVRGSSIRREEKKAAGAPSRAGGGSAEDAGGDQHGENGQEGAK